ncbi:MAG TPA: hypothetical protein VEJ47_08620 [Candidatus Eremiobacteraceae bacterium]|nr:hypothetical protein [Candidatus Eremiobacteraceae bacterium]
MEVHCNAKKGVKRRIAAIAKTQWLRSFVASAYALGAMADMRFSG